MRRIIVMGALTMLDLISSMQHVTPEARCIYYGKNEGDYSTHPDKDAVDKARFIAVFDTAPISVAVIDDFDADIDPLSGDNKIVLSA